MTPDFFSYGPLRQAHLDWFRRHGVPATALFTSVDSGNPSSVTIAHGNRAADGRFEDEPNGPAWFAFEECEDVVYWRPSTGELATCYGRAFALGEEAVHNPGTYAFDNRLDIHPEPLSWLAANRDGCVILDWSRAWSRLQNVPRVGISEEVLSLYNRHMRPPKGPETFVLRNNRRAAA